MEQLLSYQVQANSLKLTKPTTVVEEMAAFNRLPHFDGVGDANADIAYLSANFLTEPLQNLNLTLQPGIHLHWRLPPPLTHGYRDKNDPDRILFPPVPTRWFISRLAPESPPRRWLLESDYLYPATSEGMLDGLNHNAITYPISIGSESNEIPFRFLGRVLDLHEWKEHGGKGEYLHPPLTAMGYGEPTFASFYPNCRSVFGLHDSDPAEGAEYYIYGWYRDTDTETIAANLCGKLGDKDWDGVRSRLVCCAVIRAESALLPEDAADLQPEIVIANTPVEAFITHSAHKSSSKSSDENSSEQDSSESENEAQTVLDIISLGEDRQHHLSSKGPRLETARHTRGFEAVEAGTLWRIRAAAGSKGAGATQPDEVLPLSLAEQLNWLNKIQFDRDAAAFKLESWRERTFADWSRYMMATYPQPGEEGEFPDIDQIRQYITDHDLAGFDEQQSTLDRLETAVEVARDSLIGRLPELQQFRLTDIRDWRGLAQQLRDVGMKLKLEKVPELPTDGQTPDAKTRRKVIAVLNSLLVDPGLSGKLSFPGSAPAEVTEMGQPVQPIRLNRLLLEAWLPAVVRRPNYVLQATPAPRFWQPREPAVMLIDPALQLAERLSVTNPESVNIPASMSEELFDEPLVVDSMLMELIQPLSADEESNGKSWQPQLLEWEVALLPLGGPSSNMPQIRPASSDHQDFAPDFLQDHYDLKLDDYDLSRSSEEKPPGYADCIYSGRSVLTGDAPSLMRAQLHDAFKRHVLSPYAEAHDQSIDDLHRGDYDPADVLEWSQKPTDETHLSPFAQKVAALQYCLIDDSGVPSVASQSLSGFNNALLGQRQVMQLPVASPLAMPMTWDFIKRVKIVVGTHNRTAPQPQNDFAPLRSGWLEIRKLRLVNRFGLVHDVDLNESKTLIAPSLKLSEQSISVKLPPRMVKPMRLDWRWLAAANGEAQIDEHPAISPICGWLSANNLDGSVMVFNAEGKSVGTLNEDASWSPSPASDSATELDSIPNKYLKRVVSWLQNAGPKSLSKFIDTLDNALEYIDPDSAAQHEAITLLMSRPVAVLRASISLEMRGLPALNQDWNIFRSRLSDSSGLFDPTDALEDVQVPLRLGEQHHLNDGLVLYWTEDSDGSLSNRAFSPQTNTHVEMGELSEGKDKELALSLRQQPKKFTMLFDPRGSIHASCGLLPTRALSLPHEMVASALKAIEPTFRTAPILGPAKKVTLPLPKEAGYTWEWIAKAPGNGYEDPQKIAPSDTKAHFIGQIHVREGWLRLKPTTAASAADEDDSSG